MSPPQGGQSCDLERQGLLEQGCLGRTILLSSPLGKNPVCLCFNFSENGDKGNPTKFQQRLNTSFTIANSQFWHCANIRVYLH